MNEDGSAEENTMPREFLSRPSVAFQPPANQLRSRPFPPPTNTQDETETGANLESKGHQLEQISFAPRATDSPPPLQRQLSRIFDSSLPRITQARPVIQRYSYSDFATYKDAKNATIYSKELLDEQKKHTIGEHSQKLFTSDQASKIYEVNKKYYKDGKIHSDDESDPKILEKQDTTITPHIDHRFPKSKGGTNSFANAAVISARDNISKNNKTDQKKEPVTSLPAYKDLLKEEENFKIGRYQEFTQAQKDLIYQANKKYYGQNSIISDNDGITPLNGLDSSRVPHIDHITAKSEGGTNFYFNAQVLPANTNIKKSGKRGKPYDGDWDIEEFTLEQYYQKKQKGELATELSSDESESEDESEPETELPNKKIKKSE
ncbi:hypothetical protein [Oxynema aestuarii]|uniref:hypothetical protein n=1 Tax=Oxynema aestuarii TaxID=2874213 RepID=UPI001B30A8BE|nr:hypothetical protein [Oxynema aestuarii]